MRYLIIVLLAGCASTSEVVPYGAGVQVKEDTAVGNAWTGTSSRLLFSCADK
jgi:hypothetical protein